VVKTTLAQAFEAAPKVRKGPRCTIAKVLERMESTDRDAFIAALNNDELQAPFIARTLTDHGWPMTHTIVARHRRKDCQCH
jgi:Trk K+ transport system NAD-binding subunit